jgi:hypothetical protein
MIEVVLAAVLLALVAALGWLSPDGLLAFGSAVAVAGLGASVLVGVVYHVRLRAAVARKGLLPARWWLAPSRLHRLLDDDERMTVLPFFVAGVVLVAVCFGGLLLVALGAVKAYLMTR